MVAFDSYPVVLGSLISALVIILAIALRLYRRPRRTFLIEAPVRIVPLDPRPEISERQALWNALSPREEQIARLAAEDWADDEIARQLNLSVRTVQNHLQHAREKLHIHSRHELKYYLQHLGAELMTTPK